MEKEGEDQKQQTNSRNNKNLVWDCESSLYDSFELKSFNRQLDSAMLTASSRTLSMPHLPDHHRRLPNDPQPALPLPLVSKKSSKISRSFQKLLKTIFGSKLPNSTSSLLHRGRDHQRRPQDHNHFFYVQHDHDRHHHGRSSRVLSTIPEVPEIDYAGLSPELNSFVRKTVSERFTAASIGISCA